MVANVITLSELKTRRRDTILAMLPFLLALLLAGPAAQAKEMIPLKTGPTESEQIEPLLRRLREMEKEIRAHAKDADDEVKKAQEEADRITAEGEAKSKKIKEEADAYVRRKEKEIEEIRKGMPGYREKIPKGRPTRQALSDQLTSLIDPMLDCWSHSTPPEVESCLEGKFRSGIKPLVPGK